MIMAFVEQHAEREGAVVHWLECQDRVREKRIASAASPAGRRDVHAIFAEDWTSPAPSLSSPSLYMPHS